MIPNDKTAILLKKEIEGFVEHTSKVEQLLRENNLNTESKRDK